MYLTWQARALAPCVSVSPCGPVPSLSKGLMPASSGGLGERKALSKGLAQSEGSLS